jgi:hypothetical protein
MKRNMTPYLPTPRETAMINEMTVSHAFPPPPSLQYPYAVIGKHGEYRFHSKTRRACASLLRMYPDCVAVECRYVQNILLFPNADFNTASNHYPELLAESFERQWNRYASMQAYASQIAALARYSSAHANRV